MPLVELRLICLAQSGHSKSRLQFSLMLLVVEKLHTSPLRNLADGWMMQGEAEADIRGVGGTRRMRRPRHSQ